MGEQLNDKDWDYIADCLEDPKFKQFLQKKRTAGMNKAQAQQESDDDDELVDDDSEDEPAEQIAPKPRKRTNGSSYRTSTKIEEPILKGGTAGAYAVPSPPQKKQRVSATIRRKQQYLEACANKDSSVNKKVEIDGKTFTRKKGYKEWYKEQYGPQYDGTKFTMKNTNVAPRKVFQSTIVKEAYKLVQNNPKLKGKNGNSLRLKIMSSSMKKFEDVYKDPNFLQYIQDPHACTDLINDFAMELEEQIAKFEKA